MLCRNLFVPLFMICFIDAKLSANTYFYARKEITNQTRIFTASPFPSLYTVDEYLPIFRTTRDSGIDLAQKNITFHLRPHRFLIKRNTT